MGSRILLIDDDKRLADMVGRYLSQAGFEMMHCFDARSGLAALAAPAGDEAASGVDLILLDLMLPDADGLDVCRDIRRLDGRVSLAPILMLTARGELTDRVVGLELGADDYLAKPFEPRELLARVRALLRRSQMQPVGAAGAGRADLGGIPPRAVPSDPGSGTPGTGMPGTGTSSTGMSGPGTSGTGTPAADPAGAGRNVAATHPPPSDPDLLVFGRMEIDAAARQVRVDGGERPLTAYQFDLLLALARNAGRVLSRERLMDLARGETLEAFDRSIDVHIGKIRQAIENDPRQPRRLLTVRGSGYVLARQQDAG